MKKEGSLVYLAPLTVCIGIGKHVQFHINELTNTRIQNVALFLRQLVINGCGYCMPSPACQLKTIILMYWISLLSLDMSMIHGFMLMGMGIHVIISYQMGSPQMPQHAQHNNFTQVPKASFDVLCVIEFRIKMAIRFV